MNYYNYFTEVEEHFRGARNSGLFVMSPLDWVLVETWKDGGVPLEAVLKGIDRAFEAYHSRPRATTVNSVAYCTQEVLKAAREAGEVQSAAAQSTPSGLDRSAMNRFLLDRSKELATLAEKSPAGREVLEDAAARLQSLAEEARVGRLDDLEALEQRLTVLENRVIGAAMTALDEDKLLAAKRDFDAQIRRYRRQMTAAELAMLEQRFLRRRSMEELGLSRISLFYVE